jgi:hypothetical protein
MKKFLFLTTLFFALDAKSQTIFKDSDVDALNRYQATCAFTTAATTTDCAITVPATATKRIYLENIVVRSPQAATVTFGFGGTAASTNANTTVQRNTTKTASATVYGPTSGAGAAASTTTAKVSADIDTTFSMVGHVFPEKTSKTIVVSLSSTTGTGAITIFWGESK